MAGKKSTTALVNFAQFNQASFGDAYWKKEMKY